MSLAKLLRGEKRGKERGERVKRINKRVVEAVRGESHVSKGKH